MAKIIGVYKITNIVNNKVYIGSSFDIKKTLNLDNSSITKVCKGKLKTTGNFKFKYE